MVRLDNHLVGQEETSTTRKMRASNNISISTKTDRRNTAKEEATDNQTTMTKELASETTDRATTATVRNEITSRVRTQVDVEGLREVELRNQQARNHARSKITED